VHRFRTEQALHTGHRACRSVGGSSLSTPEPQLATPRRRDFVGYQRQPGDSRGRTGRGRTVEPTVELPTHTIGYRDGTQGTFMAPETLEPLAMFGLGHDEHARTSQTMDIETIVQFVGQRFCDESRSVDALRRRVELGHCFQLLWRRGGCRRAFVQTTSQPMRLLPYDTESRNDICWIDGGELTQRSQAEPVQHVDELRLTEHVDRQRGQELGRSAGRYHTGCGPCSLARRELPVSHTDTNVT
jgi:hypothetical protein